MRVFVRALRIATLPTLMVAPLALSAQGASGGRAITAADMKQFNSIRLPSISNNGQWFAYVSGLADSNATLTLRRPTAGAAETRVNLGDGGGSLTFSGDSKWFGYIAAPPKTAAGRGGRGAAPGGPAGPGGRGGPGGRAGGGAAPTPPAPAAAATAQENPAGWRFVLTNLADGSTREFPGIRRFAFNAETPRWIVMQGNGGAAAGAASGAGSVVGPSLIRGASGTGGNADLLLLDLAKGTVTNMSRVAYFAFTQDGARMAYVVQSPDRIGNSIRVMEMATGQISTIENDPVTYAALNWIDSSRTLSVVRTQIDSAASDTVVSWATYRRFTAGPDGLSATRTLIAPTKAAGFPAGHVLATTTPRYSDDLQRVFFSIRAKPTTPAPGRSMIQGGAPGAGGQGAIPPGGRGGAGAGAADSSVSLILWHYKDPRLQSAQILSETADRNPSYQAVYHVADNRVVQLNDSTLKSLVVTRGDQLAYGIDTRAYDERASYTGRSWQDVYRVDLTTGTRTLLQKRKWPSTTVASPDGRRLLFWGPDSHYWVLDLATGDSVNISRGVPTSFVNMDSDHNNLYPIPAGVRGWATDGKSVLVSDGWDIWQVPTTPAPRQAVNLTRDGKTKQIRYGTVLRWAYPATASAADGIDLSLPLYFSTYGEWTKKEGVSRVEAGRPGATPILFEDAKFSITKARDADAYFWTRMTFTEYPDWWASGPTFANPVRLTEANPQIKDLAWSSGTRLIDYRSAKGDRLQAAMYLPANYQPGKKYPMLVTIYEKRSQGKNGFVVPSETRAPDPTLYTSRGYVVLDPDIVYKLNDPGMSALWALLPAVKAAVGTGIVDEKKVGLWGHSWGGYQTAFLVTQTNIFAAAVAGAPLTDLFSMYSSVYWNSGNSNASIFEASQGRVKGNFIDNYEAYRRNSPNLHAHRMNTPLMLMHNDKDGAVDFNQGITYFNTLRQLGKPVVLLEYVGENHGLTRRPNQVDYAQRMSEFFDHHLMGAPAPRWLTDGIPRVDMLDHLKDLQTARDSASKPTTPPAAGGNR